MTQNMEQLLAEGCSRLGLSLDEAQQGLLTGHITLLEKWNRTHNLTAITAMDEMVVQHLLDSLAILPYIRGSRLLDVGSGGGFPGLPLAVADPALEVILLDSRGKRIQFLRHSVGRLGIPNVSLENCRVENYQPGEKFDTLAARAFSSLSNMVNLCRHLLVKGTRLVAMKGTDPESELDQLLDSYDQGGIPAVRPVIRVEKVTVPFLNADRHLVIIDF